MITNEGVKLINKVGKPLGLEVMTCACGKRIYADCKCIDCYNEHMRALGIKEVVE